MVYFIIGFVIGFIVAVVIIALCAKHVMDNELKYEVEEKAPIIINTITDNLVKIIGEKDEKADSGGRL